MITQGKPKPRERIIATAAALFYSHGINAVGVAQIAQKAEVSKRTLYEHFATKEMLVAAAMVHLGDNWFEASTASTAHNPRRRIRHVFEMIEPMAEKPDFFGCILMNSSIELRNTNAPAVQVVREFKIKLYEYFKQQAELMQVDDPTVLAEQLVLLYDGCSAWIVMRRTFPTSVYQTLDILLR